MAHKNVPPHRPVVRIIRDGLLIAAAVCAGYIAAGCLMVIIPIAIEEFRIFIWASSSRHDWIRKPRVGMTDPHGYTCCDGADSTNHSHCV